MGKLWVFTFGAALQVWAYERWVFQGNEFPHARAGIDVRLAPVYGQKVLQPEGMLKGESKLSRLLDAWEYLGKL